MARWLACAFGLSWMVVPFAGAQACDLDFTGKGAITYSNYAEVPPVGSPVFVSGCINFGEAPPPPRFTGSIGLDFNAGASFSYYIDGAGISGDSGAVYRGGSVSLLRGRLVAVSLWADYDSSLSDLYPRAFRGVTGFHSSDGIIREWGGKWALVPEPTSWAMLIAGFGLVGATLRRRRAASPLPPR